MINCVCVRVKLWNQSFNDLHVALPRRVKERRLRVWILVIDIATKLDQELSEIDLSITARVIEGSLI